VRGFCIPLVLPPITKPLHPETAPFYGWVVASSRSVSARAVGGRDWLVGATGWCARGRSSTEHREQQLGPRSTLRDATGGATLAPPCVTFARGPAFQSGALRHRTKAFVPSRPRLEGIGHVRCADQSFLGLLTSGVLWHSVSSIGPARPSAT